MKNHFYYDHDSPGAGGGKAGNPPAREMEKKALDKVASFPGTEQNAAGMSTQRASDEIPTNEESGNDSKSDEVDNF